MASTDQRARKLVFDAAEWDVKIGWGTGVFLTLLRVVAFIGFVLADAPKDWFFGAQILVQLLLAAAFTFGVYRRHSWAAIALAVLYGVAYFYSWVLSGRILPPLVLIGVLIWYGLYRGIRGTRALGASRSDAVEPTV
jgi:hypothetical protein